MSVRPYLSIVPAAFLLLLSASPPPDDEGVRCPTTYNQNTRLWTTINNVGPVLMIFRPGIPNFHRIQPYEFLGTVWPVTPPPEQPPPGGCDGNPDDDPEEAELDGSLLSECAPDGTAGGSGDHGGGYGDGGGGGTGFGDWLCGLAGPGVWDVYVDGEHWGTVTCVAEEVRFPVSAVGARTPSPPGRRVSILQSRALRG